MGNSIKPNWFQKALQKAIGLPAAMQVGMMGSRMMSFMGMAFNYGDWDNAAYVQQGYMGNADLYSIINAITKKAAIAPFKVYRIKQNAKGLHQKYKAWTGADATTESIAMAMRIKNMVYEEDSSHPMNQLIEKPNPWQKGNEFIINSIGYKLITGNRFLWLTVLDMGANAGMPFSVANLPPQHMQIMGDGTMYGVAGYKLRMVSYTDIPREQIIHSKYFNPDFDSMGSQLWGLSPLRAGRKNLTRSDAVIDRSVAMFQNAGAAGLLFDKSTAPMTPEQAAQIKHKVNTEVLGVENVGRIAVANGDMAYIQFGLTTQELGTIDIEKLSLQKLCNIYGLPPGFFDPDKATYSNEKEFKKGLITGAVMPELSSMRDDFNEIAKLYKDNTIYVDYDISVYPELQEDMEKQGRVMSFAWWTTGNEKRLAMGMDEDLDEPLMSQYLVPAGLMPLGQLENTLTNQLDNMIGNVDPQTGLSLDPNQLIDNTQRNGNGKVPLANGVNN